MSLQNLLRPYHHRHGGGSTSESAFYYSVQMEYLPTAKTLPYVTGRTLGSGTYAKVRAAWSRQDNQMIAIKTINKEGATREFLEKFLPREIRSMQRLRHPNVLRLYRLVETPRQVLFMLEMAHNGDLLDYINACRSLPETQARFALHGIAEGIAHCHSKGIAHRDLKCENIMLTKNMDIKIGDFGFARQVDGRGAGVSTPCGSFSYAAPELFTTEGSGKTYDAKKADVWSMGCILYAMVCGRLPFGDDSQVTKNLPKPLSFPSTITEDCKSMIRRNMLNPDVQSRCSVAQLRVAHWMRGPTATLTPYRNQLYTEQNSLPKLPQRLTSLPQVVENFSAASYSPLPQRELAASSRSPPSPPPRKRRIFHQNEQTHATFSAAVEHRNPPAQLTTPVNFTTTVTFARSYEKQRSRNDTGSVDRPLPPRLPKYRANREIPRPSTPPSQSSPRTAGIKAKINSTGRRVIHQSSSRS